MLQPVASLRPAANCSGVRSWQNSRSRRVAQECARNASSSAPFTRASISPANRAGLAGAAIATASESRCDQVSEPRGLRLWIAGSEPCAAQRACERWAFHEAKVEDPHARALGLCTVEAPVAGPQGSDGAVLGGCRPCGRVFTGVSEHRDLARVATRIPVTARLAGAVPLQGKA